MGSSNSTSNTPTYTSDNMSGYTSGLGVPTYPNEWQGVNLSGLPHLNEYFKNLYGSSQQGVAPSTGTNTTPTANLGANLSSQFYDPAVAARLPANMPGGGGGVVSGYGNAPWVNQWQRNLSGQMMQAGADPSVNWSGGNNYFNTPAGMYNPYLGQSGVMPAFGPVNNPYGGFDPSITGYSGQVDSYLNQLRPQPNYSQNPPTTDTSSGSPFAGQQVVHGNTEGWQSAGGDYSAGPQESYQAAPGTQVDAGTPTPQVNPGTQANILGRNELMKQHLGRRWGMQNRMPNEQHSMGRPQAPWMQGLLNQQFDPNAGGTDPTTGQYVPTSSMQMDAHMLRKGLNANNPYMSPQARSHLMGTLQRRYSGLF